MDLIFLFFKNTLNYGFTVFFKKIFFSGKERIPKDKKIIYAVNHPTAFIEPILVGSSMSEPVHVLLRGDAFKNKYAAWFLRKIKTIPIYRSRDGIANLRKNEQIMEEIKDYLNGGKESILILSEGTSVHEKRLRNLQKGTARIVFDTYDKHGDSDIAVVPIGVNYGDSNRFRSTICIEANDPLYLTDYLEIYQANKARGIKKLTKDLQAAMLEKVVHINDPADDDTANLLLEFNRNEFEIKPFPFYEDDGELLKQELAITENLNKKSKEEREELAKETDAYLRRLREYRAEDYGAANPDKSNFKNWLLLILGFPFHLIGLIWNYPPARFGHNLAEKKATEIRFHSSIKFGAGYLAWLVWYILWIVVTLFICPWFAVIAVAIFMPLLGRISLLYIDLRDLVSAAYCYNSLPQDEKDAIQKMRNRLLKQVR